MALLRDAEATRARILSAATREFGTHGLAGARVYGIAVAANANKSLISAYSGNKDELFDRVVETSFDQLHAAVPFTPRDLAGYATALFDYVADHPDVLRLDAWRPLERPNATDAQRAAFRALQQHHHDQKQRDDQKLPRALRRPDRARQYRPLRHAGQRAALFR